MSYERANEYTSQVRVNINNYIFLGAQDTWCLINYTLRIQVEWKEN